MLAAFDERIDNRASEPLLVGNGHVFDALIAAYTAWLGPDGLDPPPPGSTLHAVDCM